MEIEWATAETFHRLTVGHLRPILDVLVKIEWPCPDSQIPLIIDQLGWVLSSDRVAIHADTRLPLNFAIGSFSRARGQFRSLSFAVSDRVRKTDQAALESVFNRFPLSVRDMESILGPRSHEDDDRDHPGVAWDLESGGRIRLDCIGSGLQCQLLARDLADAEGFEETHDMSEYYDDDE